MESRPHPCLGRDRVWLSRSPKASTSTPWTLRGRRQRQPPSTRATERRAKQEESGSPLTDSNRRPPPYHGTSPASGRNAWQRISLVSTVSGTIAFATSCHRLQPRGSIKAPSAVCRMSSRLSSTNSARDVRRTDHPMNTRVRCSTRTIFALLPELGGHPLLVPPVDARDARTRPRRAPRGKTRSTRSGPRAGQALDVLYHRLAPARPHCWLLRGWRLRGGTSEHGRVRRREGRSPDCGRGSRPRFGGL